jgi:hypothetical protein
LIFLVPGAPAVAFGLFRYARPESAPQCCSDGISDSWPVFWTDPIGEERIVERIRESEAPGIGKISFRLDNDCAREKIKRLGGIWCRVINQPL